MAEKNIHAPASFKGVMVSSTFTDLKEHRKALIKAIDGQGLKPIAMEHDSAMPAGDVIDSSIQMVRDSSGYIGVISHKYGQVPESPERNPDHAGNTDRFVMPRLVLGFEHLDFNADHGAEHLFDGDDEGIDIANVHARSPIVRVSIATHPDPGTWNRVRTAVQPHDRPSLLCAAADNGTDKSAKAHNTHSGVGL